MFLSLNALFMTAIKDPLGLIRYMISKSQYDLSQSFYVTCRYSNSLWNIYVLLPPAILQKVKTMHLNLVFATRNGCIDGGSIVF